MGGPGLPFPPRPRERGMLGVQTPTMQLIAKAKNRRKRRGDAARQPLGAADEDPSLDLWFGLRSTPPCLSSLKLQTSLLAAASNTERGATTITSPR